MPTHAWQEASAKRARVEEKGHYAEMEFGRQLLDGGVERQMIFPMRGINLPRKLPENIQAIDSLFDGWKAFPLFDRRVQALASLALRISEKVLRALPLTRDDAAGAEINVGSPIGAFAAWVVNSIAMSINLTWLPSGDADALRTALHVIPEAERKPETDDLQTALCSAAAQLQALCDEEDSKELPMWLRFLKRGDGELAHEGVVVMSYLLGFAPTGMDASELDVRVVNTMYAWREVRKELYELSERDLDKVLRGVGKECPVTAALRALNVPEPYPSKKMARAAGSETRIKLLCQRLAKGVDETQMAAVMAAVRPLIKPDATDGESVCVVGFGTEEPPRKSLDFCNDEALKATVGSGYMDWNELYGDMNEEALVKLLKKPPFKDHVKGFSLDSEGMELVTTQVTKSQIQPFATFPVLSVFIFDSVLRKELLGTPPRDLYPWEPLPDRPMAIAVWMAPSSSWGTVFGARHGSLYAWGRNCLKRRVLQLPPDPRDRYRDDAVENSMFSDDGIEGFKALLGNRFGATWANRRSNLAVNGFSVMAERKLAAPPSTCKNAAFKREQGQAKRDAARGNDDVTQVVLAADIATHDRLRAENPGKQTIRGFNLHAVTLQEYAFGNPVLGITRGIGGTDGLQGYRKALLEAMKKHGLG